MKDTLLEKAFYEKKPQILLKIEEVINKSGLDSILLKGHVQSGKTSTYILLAAHSMVKTIMAALLLLKMQMIF